MVNWLAGALNVQIAIREVVKKNGYFTADFPKNVSKKVKLFAKNCKLRLSKFHGLAVLRKSTKCENEPKISHFHADHPELVAADAEILDVGCGNGLLTVDLAKEGFQVGI